MKFTKDHLWVRLEGEVATAGITDFAQQSLSDIVYVEVETVGDTVAKDAIFGSVEAIKTVSDLFMPMSGEIVSFNESLNQHPEVVNTDPYGEGWMVKIKISAPQEWDELLSEEDYNALIDA
ncbi:glycine cleavage system protein GcvH [Capnocytophaga sp. oral taxon 878]|uniref:glycine cleavage system protein GcvH n=1 Tax=Capnocytophaga sp. oral taxon 878 TaxID=1316596 RepID=UPI000D02CB80|nr:glycine cleavage system protein GcvH [Capnocytophaga sp. oral taxon 878]AVM49147.1 glycine cleavage system protein H [Capnocytophaga sp. oral taxon 878]